MCTAASVFRHTLCLPNTEKTTVLKLIILQIVLAKKPKGKTPKKHLLLFSFQTFFSNQPSFNPAHYASPLNLQPPPSLSFCYPLSVLKETHCYIRAKQVGTEILLSAVEGWLGISPGFKGE